MRTIILTALLAACTPADIVAPEMARTTLEEPTPGGSTEPTAWGIGNPVAMAWIDGEYQNLGEFNIFQHLQKNTFCTPSDMGEFGKHFLTGSQTHIIFDSTPSSQYAARSARLRDFFSIQNMIENIDYEFRYQTAPTYGFGLRVQILNTNFSYGGKCNVHYLID